MLHDEHRVARVDQPLKHNEQLPHVGHVQSCRRLVEDVERFAGGPLGQFSRELHPLRLTAGKRGRGLPQVEIVEPHVAEGLQLSGDVGGVGEKIPRVADFHGEQFRDVFPLPANLERVLGETGPVALFAGHPDIGQEIHVELGGAVPLAGLAAAAGHVEAEATSLPAALLRVGQHREQDADVVPHLHIRGGVAPRRAADRRLVDHDHLVEMVGTRDRVEVSGSGDLAPQPSPQLRLQHVAHQRALAAARDARHAHQLTERDLDVDSSKVVVPHTLEHERLARRLPSLRRQLNRIAARQKSTSDAPVARRHVGRRARRHHLAAALARARAEVDHPVGRADRFFVVLDHDHGVALVAEGFEGTEQLDVVTGVQADRWLVEHVEHAGEAGADLRRQPDPLALAAGERGCLAIKRKIAEAHLVEKLKP